MTRDDLKNKIYVFRAQVDNYRRAVLQIPDDHYGKEYENYETMMGIHRSQLNQEYGKLERYIDKIGGGMGMTYLTAFSDERVGVVIGAVSTILQNLDRIIGRIDGMSDDEFQELMATSQSPNILVEKKNSPHREYWRMVWRGVRGRLNKDKAISTVIITVIGGLIVAYLVYRFGWNK